HAVGIGGHGHTDYAEAGETETDPAQLEEKKARGAIKTDFILSAEIMTISLAAIPESNFWMEAATLAAVAIMITVAVYGAVAIIVKADDVGLAMAAEGRTKVLQVFGRAIVQAMPTVLKTLTIIGTAAMLWVGGSIIVHGLKELGVAGPEHFIHGASDAIGHSLPLVLQGFGTWFAKAVMDGVLGIALGLALIPVGEKLITPLWRKVFARG
ncbi:MAG: DUF808 family protein, partial [Roseobacter sp.]